MSIINSRKWRVITKYFNSIKCCNEIKLKSPNILYQIRFIFGYFFSGRMFSAGSSSWMIFASLMWTERVGKLNKGNSSGRDTKYNIYVYMLDCYRWISLTKGRECERRFHVIPSSWRQQTHMHMDMDDKLVFLIHNSIIMIVTPYKMEIRLFFCFSFDNIS